jgi:hypothetical protein
MKLQVIREDNLIEVLTPTEPLTIERCSCGQNSLTTSTGRTHYFTSEGVYDGFGFDTPATEFNLDEARARMLRYDQEREVLEWSGSGFEPEEGS